MWKVKEEVCGKPQQIPISLQVIRMPDPPDASQAAFGSAAPCRAARFGSRRSCSAGRSPSTAGREMLGKAVLPKRLRRGGPDGELASRPERDEGWAGNQAMRLWPGGRPRPPRGAGSKSGAPLSDTLHERRNMHRGSMVAGAFAARRAPAWLAGRRASFRARPACEGLTAPANAGRYRGGAPPRCRVCGRHAPAPPRVRPCAPGGR